MQEKTSLWAGKQVSGWEAFAPIKVRTACALMAICEGVDVLDLAHLGVNRPDHKTLHTDPTPTTPLCGHHGHCGWESSVLWLHSAGLGNRPPGTPRRRLSEPPPPPPHLYPPPPCVSATTHAFVHLVTFQGVISSTLILWSTALLCRGYTI